MAQSMPGIVYVPDNGGTSQGFSFGGFLDSVGNTVQDVVEYAGDALDVKAANGQAIANINNAQADAIRAKAQRQTDLMNNVVRIVLFTVIAVAAIALFSIAKK